MKTVTIPTCANPFVVIINGKKYTYPAGETVEVPDEVAEVILRHEEAKPQPEPAPEEGNGGAKSWNDLTDKPFGDESVTIEWDGNAEGKVSLLYGSIVKVSDLTPEPSELIGGTVVERLRSEDVGEGAGEVGPAESEWLITDDNMEDNRSYGLPLVIVEGAVGYAIFVAYGPFTTTLNGNNITVTEPGIYFANQIPFGLTFYTKQLTYNSIKTIDPKYLPDNDVVDLTGVFDYGTSLEQFGEVCTVDYNDTELLKRFKKGGVPIKVSVAGIVSTTIVFASTFNTNNMEFAQFNHLANVQGVLFVLYTLIGNGAIQYSCKTVETSPYIPGD